MDIINNLVFTSLNQVNGFNGLNPTYSLFPQVLLSNPDPINQGGFYAYDINVIEAFTSLDEPSLIDQAIQKHWADMVYGRNYADQTNTIVTAFRINNELVPPYHLIYAYLVENTRVVQIMEKLLVLYQHDEKLQKATTADNRLAFQWIMNTEHLFFKYLSGFSFWNINSKIQSDAEAARRNAYFRLFGMDLAFGHMQSNAVVDYYKAEFNNQGFIVLFERFLSEIWQAYANAKNAVGPNSTDLYSICDTAQKMQEMLMSRRTTEISFENYRYFNLSRMEYASVMMMSWFYQVISYDSPLVQFMRCNGNTPGERLTNIGKKVGISAHSKAEGLLDIAPPMNTLLRRIELGDYNPDKEAQVSTIITSQANALPANNPDRMALADLLAIINNWEKATGHRIKNPEAIINGQVQINRQPISQNGQSKSTLKPTTSIN